MTRANYFWAVHALILLLAAAILLGWSRHQASITIVTGTRQVAPYQDMMEKRLFNIQVDGALRLSYRLNDDPELHAAGFECVLVHRTDIDPERTTAHSRWELPFTESYVVPFDLADLQWRMPNGRILVFKKARLAQTSVYKGTEDWELKKVGPLAYNIYNEMGDHFHYENASLAEVTTRNGRRYRVTTRNGLITRVAETGGAAPERILFSAEFDDFGHCTQVQFAARPADRFDWDAEEFLTSWRSSSGSRRDFQYKDGLLAGVIGPGPEVFPIVWAENKEFVNHIVFQGTPAYVRSAGAINYIFSYSLRGIRIATKCPDETQDSVTVYNPVVNTVTQQSGRQVWRFYFPDDVNTARSNKLEIIDSAK
jgi:hypothetical protein